MTNAWNNRIIGHGEEAPDQLLANPRNFRVHPKHQQDALAGVLEEVGVVQNVIVNQRTGFLLDGHLRVSLALRQGQPTIPVVYVDLDESEEALVLSTLDPISALAGTDAAKLDDLLRDVTTGNEAVQAMLDTLAESAGLYPDAVETGAGGDEFDTTPDDTQTRVQRGDLWQLGRHRLLCGDSTNAEDVARLMQGERAQAVVSDPPYGVLKVQWDRLFTQQDLDVMFSVTDGTVACFNANRTDVVKHMLDLDPIPERMSVWRTNSPTPTAGLLRTWQPIFWWRCGHVVGWDSIDWHAEQPTRTGDHPTQKPVAFIQKLIEMVTTHGASVFEPFLGSGTTLIAAERTGRRCYGIEIEPKYCDVILRRWEAETGQHAVKVDGLTI